MNRRKEMKTLAVIKAQSKVGLHAVAAAHGLTVITETLRQFDELGYFEDPSGGGNHINIGEAGWVALAKE
jgi:hypothetical protein